MLFSGRFGCHHKSWLIPFQRRGLATASATAQLNCSRALTKSHERASFQSIVTLDVTALQGIGPKSQEQLHQLRLKSVKDLATYKFYHLAKAITTLAETEEENGRLLDAAMNINKGVDKAYESQSLREIVKAPVAALQGISEDAGGVWKQLGVRTVGDLARFKYCMWAEAMETSAKFEEAVEVESTQAD